MFNFQKLQTKTGIPVYVMPLPHAQSVAAGVFVKAGTRDEQWPKEAGLAHALEHMS
ncbi:MAG: peptidase M16, partial [Candidatus Brennerbacteria bacterium CG11_big_fil_rev_8_21_14_0_20_43_10]